LFFKAHIEFPLVGASVQAYAGHGRQWFRANKVNLFGNDRQYGIAGKMPRRNLMLPGYLYVEQLDAGPGEPCRRTSRLFVK